jgi:hypothetical protein
MLDSAFFSSHELILFLSALMLAPASFGLVAILSFFCGYR